MLKSQEDIKQVTEPHMVTGTMEEIELSSNASGTFFGGGGAGAYGGNATSGFSGGGGGGSGYTSGDLEIIETNQGGNATNRAWATIALKGV